MNAVFFSKDKISRISIYVLMLSLLFDIGGGIGIKYIVLAPVLLVFLFRLLSTSFPKAFLIEFFLLSIFLSIVFISGIRGNSLIDGFSEISFLFFVIILLVGRGSGSEFIINVFLFISTLASVVVTVSFLLIAIAPEISLSWAQAAYNNRLGYIGIVPFSDGTPNIYFRWSAWLSLGFSLALFQKRISLSILIFTAALLTMSTAIVFGLILVAVLYSVYSMRFSFNKIVTGVGVIFILIFISYSVLALFPDLSDRLLSKFSSDSSSTSTKLGHITSIIFLMIDNPIYMLIGQGPGVAFYSSGVNMLVTNVEVSHFNLLRQFGFFGFFAYVSYVFYVMLCLSRLGRLGLPWIIGLFVIFLIAGTNPLLLSPVFFVPLVLARLYVMEFLYERRYG